MRVDDVPWFIKPAFHAYGYGFGTFLHSLTLTTRHTCHIERLPAGRLDHEPRIDCFWHEHLPAYVATCLPPLPGVRHVLMNHPIWHMRAVHVLLYWNGVEKLALGSTGHGGRAALATIVEHLKRGYSTAVAVDGPAGPFHDLKPGALDMALESGVPLVPLRFEYEREVRWTGWDRKHFPLPYSRVRVIEGAKVQVTRENYEAARTEVRAALG